MNKKTITTLALAVSVGTAARTYIAPVVEEKTICLPRHARTDGSFVLGKCDETRNNQKLKRKLLANGCAEGQDSVIAVKREKQKKFDIEVKTCLSPNTAQL